LSIRFRGGSIVLVVEDVDEIVFEEFDMEADDELRRGALEIDSRLLKPHSFSSSREGFRRFRSNSRK
jgi:hypothetical protein